MTQLFVKKKRVPKVINYDSPLTTTRKQRSFDLQIYLRFQKLVLLVGMLFMAKQSFAQNIPSYNNFYRSLFMVIPQKNRMPIPEDTFLQLEFGLNEHQNFEKQIEENPTGTLFVSNFPLPSKSDRYVRQNYLVLPLAAEPMRFVVGKGIKTRIILDVKTVGEIYAGKVRYWDDAAIVKSNPGTKMPHQLIVPFYSYWSSRSDKHLTLALGDCASSFALFEFLTALDPQWKAKTNMQTEQIYARAFRFALKYCFFPPNYFQVQHQSGP